jgi:hypothetical protein
MPYLSVCRLCRWFDFSNTYNTAKSLLEYHLKKSHNINPKHEKVRQTIKVKDVGFRVRVYGFLTFNGKDVAVINNIKQEDYEYLVVRMNQLGKAFWYHFKNLNP